MLNTCKSNGSASDSLLMKKGLLEAPPKEVAGADGIRRKTRKESFVGGELGAG